MAGLAGESPTIRLACGALGGLALVSVAGIIGLSATDRLQDAALAALSGVAGGASGALATLLTTFTPAPVPGGRRATDPIPEPVEMTPQTTAVGWGDPRSYGESSGPA